MLLFLFCTALSAQVPSNPIGLNPPGLKWRQINTDKVQVIFPVGLDSAGLRVANTVHYLWNHGNTSIGDKMHKVTILFQNQTVAPNGFVTVGPFRSEYNLTPSQFNCTTDWLDLLAIHEYRHVKQFGNSRHGLTQLAKSIFGSWGWGGFMAAALPRWYFEGDAVGAETALSKSGRGRMPSFDMEYRALRLNGIHYGYEKAGAGSLKDFVPDWYGLGYYLTTHARSRYGADIWEKVVADAVRYRGLFYPFSRNLKQHTGLTAKALYAETMATLDSIWQADPAKKNNTASPSVNQKIKKTVTDYTNPHFLSDGSMVVEKRAYNEIPGYYQISQDGKETLLTRPGILFSPPNSTLSVQNNKLCWAELGFDPRWGNQNFSVIVTYDIPTKKKKRLSHRSKYFSPALSHDGKRIVAVEADEQMQYRLVILDAENGQLLQTLPNSGNWFLSFPRWMPKDQEIVMVAQKGEVNRLQIQSLHSGTTEILVAPTNQQLTHPFPSGEAIYFSATYTGVNNIFKVDRGSRHLYQVTDDLLGAFQPGLSADGRMLLYSSFNSQGYNIHRLELSAVQQKRWDQLPPFDIHFFEPLVEQEGGSIFTKIPNQQFPVNKFNKWSGLVNFHSWLPQLSPPLVGASILSDNKFGTMSGELSGYYNLNDNEWSAVAGLTYAELYPVINLNYSRINRSNNFYRFERSTAIDTLLFTNFYTEEWIENRYLAGLALPLNFSKGTLFHQLTLRANYQRTQLDVVGNLDNPGNIRDTLTGSAELLNNLQDIFRAPIQDVGLDILDLRIGWQSLRRRAIQNLNPHWGIVLDARYRTTIGTDQIQADNLLLRADAYLPGLGRNHSLYFNTFYQKMDILDNYRFSDFFVYPRGYNTLLGDENFKFGINYSFPIAYPDLALGSLAFIKRIKANIFYDQGWQKAGVPFSFDRTARSTGLELRLDFRAFRLLEIDLGVRYSYLLDEDRAPGGQVHQFDFLLISITQ
ncbi:MAG: hypothetical protein DHS20C18_13710 [Saprospiraceae bacterium]|nr:MAG: hypothetical protein DHS20C18_13710 [Saprospiraceae bacterium]